MKFTQYYSGSKANLYTVESVSGDRLLIECGAKWKQIQQALGYDLSRIGACFVSHEHADHCRAASDVIAAGIDVGVSSGTMQHMNQKIDVCYMRRLRTIRAHELLAMSDNDLQVWTFDVFHDAQEPLGFLIRDRKTEAYMLFATDTSHIRQRFNIAFEIIALECSYDKAILQERVDSGDINETLAKRLLTSHMEKGNCMAYLQNFCDLSKCRQIHLLHMSQDNIDKEKTRAEFEKELFIETVICGGTECLDTEKSKRFAGQSDRAGTLR